MYRPDGLGWSLKAAGFAGICACGVALILTIVVASASSIASQTSEAAFVALITLLQVLFIPSIALFTYGFASLGQKCGNVYLQVLAYVSIAVGVTSGIILTISFYNSGINAPFWETILNTLLSSVIGLGIAVTLVPLWTRFGFAVGICIGVLAVLDLLGLLGLASTDFGIFLQLALFGSGAALFFRAANEAP